MAIHEKAILLFREQGNTGERFADTVARLGFEQVQEQLMRDDLACAQGGKCCGAEASEGRCHLLT